MDYVASDEYHETLSMVHALSLGCNNDSGIPKQHLLLPAMDASLKESKTFEWQDIHQRKQFVGSDLLSRHPNHEEEDAGCLSDIPQGISVEMAVLQDIAKCIRTELKSEVHLLSLLLI
jgi:hypothetical protein